MRSLGKVLGLAIICALFINSVIAMDVSVATDTLIKKAQDYNYASSSLQSVGIKTLEELTQLLNTTGKDAPEYDKIQNAIVSLRINLIKCGQFRVNLPADYSMGAADRVSGAARAFESFEYFNSPEGASALKASGSEDEYKGLADRRHVILEGARGYLSEARKTKVGWAQSAVAKIEQEQLKQTLKPQIARIEANLRDVQESDPYKRAMKIIKELKEKAREYSSDPVTQSVLCAWFIGDIKNIRSGKSVSTPVREILSKPEYGIADDYNAGSMILACGNFSQFTDQKNKLLSQLDELNAIREFLKDKPTITLDGMESKLQALTQEYNDLEQRFPHVIRGQTGGPDLKAARARQAAITKEKTQLKPIIAFFNKS